MTSTSTIPPCPLCLETLGRYGGPVTLPCGHNGCLHCLATVRDSRRPQCPLCRAPFDPSQQLKENHELRDLITLATCLYMDEKEQADGWEAFPDAKLTAEHYASEFKSDRTHVSDAAQHHYAYPSAPSMQALMPFRGRQGDKDLLALEPPPWLPDSYAIQCGGCHLPFRALTRLRHHCRMCGKIFCHACCHKKLLLPPKYACREPQRVCEMCSTLLQPLQPFLAGIQSHAVQPPVHDATDAVALRSWLNSPWSSTLDEDIYKVANIVRTFTQAPRLQPELGLPTTVLQGAKGLAVLSVVKLGAGWSCTFGTGLVVSRGADNSWSAPSAVACYGVGWGLQLGGELTDLLLVLRTDEAVRAVCTNMHVGLGGSASMAMGHVGRHADAAFMLGSSSAATAYSYSYSKGAFIGISLQGTVLATRNIVNLNFYGYPVTARQLLIDHTVPQPPAATLLYDALKALMQKYENRGMLVHSPQTTPARNGPSSTSRISNATSSAAVSKAATAVASAPAAPAVAPAAMVVGTQARAQSGSAIVRVAGAKLAPASCQASAPPPPAALAGPALATPGLGVMQSTAASGLSLYPAVPQPLLLAPAPPAGSPAGCSPLPDAPSSRVVPRQDAPKLRQQADEDDDLQYYSALFN